MNHQMGPGAGQPPSYLQGMPMHPHQSRRQQEYHAYQHMPPQSPMHPHPYAPWQQPYYPHPAQHQYPPQRWQNPYPPQYMPPPQPPMPYPPRSPMVVTSQPNGHAVTPVTRHTSMQMPSQQAIPSPRPVLQHAQHSHTPAASPSPAPAAKQEHVPLPPQTQPEPERKPETPSAPASRRQSQAQTPLALSPELKTPYYPTLPWYSNPESKFPRREMARRRRRQTLRKPTDSLALPTREGTEETTDEHTMAVQESMSDTSTIAAPSEPETPATSQAPSENDFMPVSAPTTPAQASTQSPKATGGQSHGRRDTRTAIAVPNIGSLPKAKPSPPAADRQDALPSQDVNGAVTSTSSDALVSPDKEQFLVEASTASAAPAPKAVPRSWADLVRTKGATGAVNAASNGVNHANGASVPKSASLAEALRQYNVENDAKLSFLEPRGLVNTGNMCYMNSILQVLVFCAPFYNFLDQVRQRTVHSMKSNTPLIDATIMFMREFKVLGNADSADVLRKMLKQDQLEHYGEPVTPEYVYEAIRNLPRFANMRRGHQQDAEEFLGFLLEGLHDECADVMQGQLDDKAHQDALVSPSAEASGAADGWLEVGPKQKAAITRTAGQQEAPSPITKIFGGHLRSELRVPGLKDSVTLEPYKPLQLDIGAQHVTNIVDALKGITRQETLTGAFGGKSDSAKKQVFIDSLPPVLILHLKRFQYDNSTAGTQKIWKKVGYPLELEIPKEVFPPAKRGGLAMKGGLPKYRLISVVYHHGKSAAGGHYTVDVLRQDSREWIRMDDTIIRRVRPEDVAEGGAEEDPKLLAKALEQHKADEDLQKQRNMYQGLDEADREPEEEKPWSEVNGLANGKKQWSAVATTNGTATPGSTTGKRTPTARKEGVKDNKVAYILLYERIRG